MKSHLIFFLLVTVLITAGCVSENKTIPISPTLTTVNTPSTSQIVATSHSYISTTPTNSGQDPIVGSWVRYPVGNETCKIKFSNDGTYEWNCPASVSASFYKQCNLPVVRAGGWIYAGENIYEAHYICDNGKTSNPDMFISPFVYDAVTGSISNEFQKNASAGVYYMEGATIPTSVLTPNTPTTLSTPVLEENLPIVIINSTGNAGWVKKMFCYYPDDWGMSSSKDGNSRISIQKTDMTYDQIIATKGTLPDPSQARGQYTLLSVAPDNNQYIINGIKARHGTVTTQHDIDRKNVTGDLYLFEDGALLIYYHRTIANPIDVANSRKIMETYYGYTG